MSWAWLRVGFNALVAFLKVTGLSLLKFILKILPIIIPVLEKWKEANDKKKRQRTITPPDPLIDTRRQRLRDKIREKERAESNGGNVEGDPEP